MKRSLILFFVCLPALLVCAGCNGIKGRLNGWNGDILTVMLGYESEVEGDGRDIEHGEMFEGMSFISFIDRASYEQAHTESDTLELPDNHYGYSKKEQKLLVKTYPELAQVNNVRITSSDPSILEIVEVDGNEITVITHKLGDVELHLDVDGPQNALSFDYPVRIYFPVDVNFYITPYWWHTIGNTRLRYKVKEMPPGVSDMVAYIKDSVTVCGYCTYYDFRQNRSPKVKRDTVTLPLEEQVSRFKKNKRILIRNVTSAIREVEDKSVTGYIYAFDEETLQYADTLSAHEFKFKVEQVILDFNIVSPNPYLEFHYITKYTKAFEHYADTDDDIDDGGSDGDSGDIAELTVNYYTVLLNLFTTEEEKQAMLDELNRELEGVDYQMDLSDEEKDARIAEINKHKKKGE